MASEAEPSGEDIMKAAHEDAGVEIPRESAMSRKLQQIISRFRIREEGSRRFTSEEEEAERLDTEIKKFSTQKKHAKVQKHRRADEGHYEKGRTGALVWKPQFEFFHLVNDDALEAATMRMVNSYDHLHGKKGEWGKERIHSVKTYLKSLRGLRDGERKRLSIPEPGIQ